MFWGIYFGYVIFSFGCIVCFIFKRYAFIEGVLEGSGVICLFRVDFLVYCSFYGFGRVGTWGFGR